MSIWDKIEKNNERRREVKISHLSWDEVLTTLSEMLADSYAAVLTTGKYGKSLKITKSLQGGREITVYLTIYNNNEEVKEEEEVEEI